MLRFPVWREWKLPHNRFLIKHKRYIVVLCVPVWREWRRICCLCRRVHHDLATCVPVWREWKLTPKQINIELYVFLAMCVPVWREWKHSECGFSHIAWTMKLALCVPVWREWKRLVKNVRMNIVLLVLCVPVWREWKPDPVVSALRH